MPEPENQLEIEFSEAELTGEGEPGEGESKEQPPPESEPAKEPEKTPEPTKEPTKEPEKPPAGFVPHGAFHAERARRQELQAELEALRKAQPAEERADPAALILEDPEASIRSLVATIEELRGEMTRKDLEREIKAAVPDFFEKAPQMEELLRGEGLSEESIRSMIGSVGVEVPTLFKVLDKLVSAPNEATMRTKITAELTQQITAEVTKQLVAKFNLPDPGVDIGRLPGTVPDGKLNVDGEEEFARLTPKQQEAWLSGG